MPELASAGLRGQRQIWRRDYISTCSHDPASYRCSAGPEDAKLCLLLCFVLIVMSGHSSISAMDFVDVSKLKRTQKLAC